MNFEDLQNEWRAVKSEPKSHDELRRMMYASPISRFRRLTVKEVLGFASLGLYIAFLIKYQLYQNLITDLFLIWSIVSVLDQYLGMRYVTAFSIDDSMEKTVTDSLTRIKRLIWASWIINLLIWIVLVVILGMKEDANNMSYMQWALMLLPLLGAVSWWSAKKWSKKKTELKALLRELNDEEPLAAI